MADISHEIKIKAPKERVFAALTTLQGLSGWHSSGVDGVADLGGVIVVSAPGAPVFEWKVTRVDKPNCVEWTCVKGPGNSVGTRARFDLSAHPDGRTFVELSHAGWPDTRGNFRKCNTLWGVLLHHLRKYVETGAQDPAFA
jgi:uncharacterized protein YndB with AHSA1/START domain